MTFNLAKKILWLCLSFLFTFKARLNQQVVLQGHTDTPIEPKTENLSEINNEEIAKETAINNDVPMSNTNSQLDQHIMDTLDDMKNPTSDLNLDNIHSAIFSENIAPVTENMDLPLTASSMNVDPPITSPTSMSQANQIENNVSSWNHNSLSINNENDGLNALLKADKNLNQMNNQSSEGNALQTPMSVPDNRLITSTDLAPLSEAITPSSLGLPLVSPVETLSKDTPLSCNSNTDLPSKDTKSPSPTPTSPIANIINEVKPMKVFLNSPYELPKICLLMNENDVPKPPPRPLPVPITQLYPPTPSITVCISFQNQRREQVLHCSCILIS